MCYSLTLVASRNTSVTPRHGNHYDVKEVQGLRRKTVKSRSSSKIFDNVHFLLPPSEYRKIIYSYIKDLTWVLFSIPLQRHTTVTTQTLSLLITNIGNAPRLYGPPHNSFKLTWLGSSLQALRALLQDPTAASPVTPPLTHPGTSFPSLHPKQTAFMYTAEVQPKR